MVTVHIEIDDYYIELYQHYCKRTQGREATKAEMRDFFETQAKHLIQHSNWQSKLMAHFSLSHNEVEEEWVCQISQ